MTAGEVVFFASALFAIACATWRLLTERPDEPQSYTPPIIHRAIEEPAPTDALWDTSTAGMLRHFSTKAIEAMRKGEHAAGFARMAASCAFRLHPELRGSNLLVMPSPVSRTVDPGERDGQRRRVIRSMNVEVIH